jgi:L-ascorbate metabolism protein UlaG (beta-lactamase superfamily)
MFSHSIRGSLPSSLPSPLTNLLVLVALLALGSSCSLNPPPFDEAVWRTKVQSADPALLYAPHFKDDLFFNPWMPNEDKGFLSVLKWRLTASQEYTEEEKTYLPRVVDKAKERILAMPQGDFIMWVGHATFLIRLNGEYWLVDPIFSERAVVVKRKTPAAITAEALKEVAPTLRVIITHNHYDHLDTRSIEDLPENTKMFVPLGLKEYVRDMNKRDVTEMDWWQEIHCGNGITLVCLPMQHWSRRFGQEPRETLWASYMLITPTVTIYLGGDTGYFVGYKEIAKRYPKIDYALLPTTAYHPRWFMHYNHMNVDEAIEAFNDLNARYMISQQWGTFHLGDEPPGYSILELKRTIAERKLDASRFVIMDIGGILPIENQ